MRYSSRGSRFGMAPAGNGANMEALGAAMEARGSRILRHTNCQRIVLENDRAVGVIAKSANEAERTYSGDHITSNTGPVRTIELAGGRGFFDDPDYLARLDSSPHEARIFHISFVTDAPLIEGFDGCMVFGNTRNLIYLEIPSMISPQVSPEGAVPAHRFRCTERYRRSKQRESRVAKYARGARGQFPRSNGRCQNSRQRSSFWSGAGNASLAGSHDAGDDIGRKSLECG